MELNHKQLEMIRAAVKPGDGWDGDAWELRLCEEAIAFARRAERAASNPASPAKDCGACGDGCPGRACRVEVESPPASPALQADFETWAKAENYDMDARDGTYESLLTAAAWEGFQAARRAASPAPVAAITDEKLWALIDAYADMQGEYQFSTARHLAKQQRENVEGAKAELRAALSSAPMAQAEPGESLSKIVLEAVYRACQRGGSPEQLHAAIMSGIAATPAVPAAPSEREPIGYVGRDALRILGEYKAEGIEQSIRVYNYVDEARGIVSPLYAAPAAPIERENGQ